MKLKLLIADEDGYVRDGADISIEAADSVSSEALANEAEDVAHHVLGDINWKRVVVSAREDKEGRCRRW